MQKEALLIVFCTSLLCTALLFGCSIEQEAQPRGGQVAIATEEAPPPKGLQEEEIQEERLQKGEILSVVPLPGMAFEVDIPENTLPGDIIKIFVFQKPYRLEKIGPTKYQVFLNETQLFPWESTSGHSGETIHYRYSRNGWDYYTAEYLEPTLEEPDRDTNDYFWTKQGREASYEPGKVQHDAIGRWRFFPKRGLPDRTTNLAPRETFLPRVNNEPFRSGQTMEDLYIPGFYDFFNSTAQHMKRVGYRWVEFDPPWQWAEENGLPKVVNDITHAPNYPDDETFLEEVRAHQAAGLQVLIVPQLCCTALHSKDRTKEWWEAYFQETERFLLHFASLAEKAQADAFMYAVPSWEMENVPLDINAKWRDIFTKIHHVFSGEVGQMVWLLGPEVSPTPVPIPSTTFIQWADQLDFILVATEFPLSSSDNPTDDQLREGALAIVDGAKIFYDQFRKPVIFRTGYFNVRHSWKGQAFYQIDSIPGPAEPEANLKGSRYEFDTEDHARTVHALFRAIATRPWAIGYFHFGYTHWEDPLSPWMSIRGKPAEDIWRKWNEKIYEKAAEAKQKVT